MTRAQRAVLGVLDGAGAFLSAQEIHARLRATGAPIGLTSVYRAVQSLAEQGALDAHRGSGGETAYRLCGTRSHHHHLVCRGCGSAVEIEAPRLERWVAATAQRHGYRVEGHTLEVTGVCPACTGR